MESPNSDNKSPLPKIPDPKAEGSVEYSKDPVKQYLDQIGQYRQLTREEEVELSKIVQESEDQQRADKAVEMFVQHNLKLVVSIAKDFTRGRFSILELVSPGNEGLMIAAQKYDGTKGVPFANYAAFWIKQRIMKYCTEHGFPVRVPPYRSALINQVLRANGRLKKALGREPSADEVAQELEKDPEEVQEVMRLLQPAKELDAPMKGDEDGSAQKTYFSDELEKGTDMGEETLGEIDRKRAVRKALSVLEQRDANVLIWYFGLEGHRELDLEQIGQRLGVSRERARQIKSDAIEVLREEGSLSAFYNQG